MIEIITSLSIEVYFLFLDQLVMEDINVPFVEVHYVSIQKVGDVPIVKGDLQGLPTQVGKWVAQMVQLCAPRGVYICDGSDEEADMVTLKLLERGTLTKLTKYENNYICWTDPRVRENSSMEIRNELFDC